MIRDSNRSRPSPPPRRSSTLHPPSSGSRQARVDLLGALLRARGMKKLEPNPLSDTPTKWAKTARRSAPALTLMRGFFVRCNLLRLATDQGAQIRNQPRPENCASTRLSSPVGVPDLSQILDCRPIIFRLACTTTGDQTAQHELGPANMALHRSRFCLDAFSCCRPLSDVSLSALITS